MRKAKKFLLIAFLLLLISHFSLNIIIAATVDDVVERIQKKYAEIQDIQGRFFQTSYIKDLERVEKYSGKFFIKKPSQMRWEYKKPRDEEVIIRGSDTWIYRKSEKQVLKSKFTKGAYNQVPIALLGSLENLKADFDITMIKKDTLELKPKHQMGFIKKLIFETTSEDLLIKMFTIFDTYGNKIVIELEDVEINPGLDDSLFIFKAPPGVEVFELNP
jgi:outer membrane lipoprotein carrier protein